MEEIQCCHCGGLFPASPKHKEQYYCQKPSCRRAMKAAWKRKKMREDPDYRLTQKMSNRKWAEAHPGYWKEYRKRHPEKAERNRILQRIRNGRRCGKGQANSRGSPCVIAKVDSSIPNKNKVVGQFWMVPVIAKVDPLKVYIYEIPALYQ